MKAKLLPRLASLLVLVSVLAGTRWAVYAADRSMAAQATTSYSFIPVADAYVTQANPGSNYGTSTVLRADNSPIKRSYLRFVVQGLNGGVVQSARIRLYSNSTNATGFSVRALANNSWSETGITYNSAPAVGSVLRSKASITSGTWVSLDISSYVKAQGTYSVAVTTSSSANMDLASREASGKAPQLVVTVATSPTATPTKTAAPTSGPTRTPAATATQSATDWQPTFPIRAAFYYPWFPEAWTQQSIYPYTNYTPTLGFYSSRDVTTLKKHLDMMQYANIQAGIASWWGQGSQTDLKIAGLLSAAAGTHFRWTLYYENESLTDPTASQIQSDLTYIRDHYGNDPNFLRVNGKFVVFVYAAGNDACGMADRWTQGNTVGAYVVLKVFGGYTSCSTQPNSWHQYSPAVASDRQGNLSFSISPGFWQKGLSVRLARDLNRWAQNVKDMVASGANWQLVTTFSEWGEGTPVEPAAEWSSASGYGQYLDALHYNGNMP